MWDWTGQSMWDSTLSDELAAKVAVAVERSINKITKFFTIFSKVISHFV